MKTKITAIYVGVLFAAVFAGSLAAQEIPAKITFRVQDDAGQAVSNAVVNGYFLSAGKSSKGQPFKGVTDGKGIVVVEGKTLQGISAEFVKSQYHKTTVKEEIKQKRNKSDITSWIRDLPVVLKRIKKPVAMQTRTVMNPYVQMQDSAGAYNFKNSAKYDLTKGDFLPPHGKGLTNDVEFAWEMSIQKSTTTGRPLEYKTKCDIKLPGKQNGIVKGTPDGDFKTGKGSALISGYEAPADGYSGSISFYKTVADNKVDSNDDNHYLYYFRIRSELGRRDAVTNAVYGKIYGPVNGNFQYYLNPVSNDRNMEDDPAKNIQLK